jgi:hypothetical protein
LKAKKVCLLRGEQERKLSVLFLIYKSSYLSIGKICNKRSFLLSQIMIYSRENKYQLIILSMFMIWPKMSASVDFVDHVLYFGKTG